MNAHLIPNTTLFVPGNETHPPTRADTTELPTLASYNIFAAIGLAYQLKKPTIWAINHKREQDNTYTIDDLRTRAGRDHRGIENDSKEAQTSAAAHLAHITFRLTATHYIAQDSEESETVTPMFTLTDAMWKDGTDGMAGKGPNNNFNPSATLEFRTLAAETLDRLSLTGIRNI
jgi:hypothetical protein